MEDFNKIISFVLGLIVVVVALVFITRKYDLSKKLLPFSSTAKVSVTPTIAPTQTKKPISEVIITQKNDESNKINNYQGQVPRTIPSTGSPTLLLPIFASALLTGFKLRKKN